MTIKKLVRVALVATIYTVMSLVLPMISFGPLQLRIAEAMALLPLIMPETILGLTIGCLLTNLFGAIMGANIIGYMDIVIGTLATLIAALITYYARNIRFKEIPLISISAPIIINALIIGLELYLVLFPIASIFVLFALIGEILISQSLVIVFIGIPLVEKIRKSIKNVN